MRKKDLLTMLTLLFVAMGSSGKLFAEIQNPVAKVGNTEYATIDEAIANWTNGSTLTLLADVTLSDVIKLSSTEHHILDLGSYTMTAASKKDAIQIVNNGRTSASYALDIKADAENPGGITASGKAVVKTTGKSGVKDRPIIRFYNGVFTGTNVVYHSGSNGTNCPQFWFYGGEFNGTVYANRALFQFYGGTFNGSLQISVDSSAYALIAGGKFKQLSNLYGSALNSDKFTIGSAKGNYNRGIYVDAEGYYVVTSNVITEVSAKYPAVKKETYNSNNYFYYSAANTYGMFYEVASMAGTGSNVTIWEGVEVAEELENNEAFKYSPILPNDVEDFEVEIKDIVIDNNATTKVVFNVEPKDANGNKVATPSSSITFRLPVPAAWSGRAKVYHDGTPIGKFEIKNESEDKYIELASATFSEFAVELVISQFAGNGTENSPYIIDSAEKLAALRAEVNDGEYYEGVYFKLTENITLSDEWTAIGNGSRSSKSYTGKAFKGVFDGDNKTISGLTITSTTAADAAIGLFGVVDGGTVKNLNLTNVNINVSNSNLAGAAIGMMLNGATADNITVSGAIVGYDGVGGIVGRLIIDGTINGCTNNASVTTSYGGIGGIVGKAYYEDGANTSTFANITGCTNKGTIKAVSYAGGIVGLARANVYNCVNEGEIQGGTQTGGIVGQLIAAGSVSGNENKAKVSGTSHVGGIIGDYTQSGSYTYNNVTIANNTNRGEISATGDCAAILGCNNVDGFTAMTATGNLSYYYVEGLQLFGNPEDMVIDATNKFMIVVAKLGEVEYYTLADAIAAAQTGDEIVMLSDVTLAERVTIPAGKTLTIDLNGKAISMEESIIATAYAINNLGNLTITDGVGSGSINARGIYNGYGDGAANVASATITVSGGTFNAKGTNGGAAIFNYGTANVNGGNFTSIGGYSLNNQAGASMTIADGVTANNGIYASGATLVVNGGEISGNRSGCHVLYAWNSTVTINDGEFYNNNSGNSTTMAAGTTELTINGGTFGIKDGRVPGNGNTWTSCLTDTQNSATMTVNGGTFNGGFRVQGGTTMTINGGSFNDCCGSGYNIYGTAVVKGGTFTDAAAQTFAKNNISDDCTLDEDGKVVSVVAKIGETKYETLDKAFAAATEGQTITLLADAIPVLTSQRAITKAAVIDLGGKTLTLKEDDLYFGTTTFQNGNIVVDPSVSASTAVFWMFENQTLTFNEVDIVATGVTGTYLIGINGGTGTAVNLLNSSITIDNETQANLTAVICDNGTNNNVTIQGSTINVKNIVGRFYLGGSNGNIAVENTTATLNGVKEGFYLRAGQSLAIKGTSNIDIILNETEGRYGINLTDITATYTKAETATVNATVYEVPAVAMIGTAKYASLQAAINAVNDGETVVLVSDCAEVVSFTQTADKSFVIDGNNKIYTGSINITARADKDAPSTLVIKNFNFNTDAITHDFIKSVETNYYPNNITISGCKFNGTTDINTTDYAVVAVRLKSANNIKIENCTGSGLHSFLQNTAGWNIQIDNVDVTNSLSGFAMGTVQGANIKNCDLVVNKSGIRFDAQYNNNAVIESNTVKAFIPVVVRKASVDSNITFNGTNEFTPTNTDGLWCAIGTSEYEANGELPTAATAKVKVVVNSNLPQNGLYGNYKEGSLSAAYVGGTGYWGECGGNANYSFELKFYNDDTFMGSTSLNDVDNIIDGDVYVTWNMKLDATSNTDEYWTMSWTKAPTIAMQPNRVEQWIDGVKVTECTIQPNGPDNLNPIVAAVADNNDVIKSYATSFASAVDAAQEGLEVAILKAGTYALKVKNNITITGAVEGVEFANIGAFGCNGANVTFNNVTFTYAENSTYKGLQHSGNLVYNNCTFNGQVFLYGQSETFNNCTFNTTDSNNYNVWTYGAKEVVFNGCTFECAGKSVLIYAESATVFNDVTVTKCTFIASTAVEGKAAIEMDSSLTSGINLTIDDETIVEGFGNGNISGNSLWNNKKGNADAANNDITVKVDDVVVLAPIYEAQIGETGYRTLADAFNAAQAGDVVKVFAGEYAQGLTVNKAITVLGETDAEDNNLVTFNGKLSITADGATVKNINFTNSGTAAYVGAKNVTIDGCSLVGSNGLYQSYTSGLVTFKNSYIKGGTYGIHFDGNAGGEIVVENCTVIGWTSFAKTIEKVTFTGTVFEEGNYNFVRLYQEEITINGCTFNENMMVDLAVDGAIANVNGCTVEGGRTVESLFYGADIVNSNIYVDEVLLTRVAKVGDNYYATLQEAFAAIGNGAGKTVELLCDVDLAGAEWTPIGTSENPFKGTFDGKNHTISNLYINGGSNSNQGFFGYTTDGEIKNVTFINANVSGRLNVAVVAGTPYTSKYTKVKVKGHVEVNGMAYVGGVGGKNAYANWTDITVDVDETSYVNANSVENGTAYRTYVGGVIGFNGEGAHTFKNISSNIKVIGSTQDVGGVFGIAHYGNNFENVTFTGSVEAPAGAEEVGGIAGVWHNEKGYTVTFTNCKSEGKVKVGGVETEGYSIVGGAYNAANETSENSGSLIIDGNEAWLKVAKTNGVKYLTLAAAIEAVEDCDTITLISNEIFTEKNRYNNGGWWDGLGYSGDKSFTIDLNEKTVSQDGSLNDYLFWFQNKGTKDNTITIMNGTLDAGTTAYCALCTASSHDNKLTVNTEDVTLINNISNGSTVKIRAGSEYNAKAGTKIIGKNSYLGIENWKATVNIYDGAEIYMNGTSSYNGCLVGVGGGGTINVYGGYGKGVKGGFIAMTSGGTINIEGGEWIANTDGTVGNNSNLYVLTAQSNKYESGFAGPSIINVTGGTFRGGMDAWVLNNIEGEKAELNISGGNFNVNPTRFVEEGYVAIANNDNTLYTVGLAIATVNGVTYIDLQEAIEDAGTTETTITIMASFSTDDDYTIAAGQNITLDLNGKTITGTDNATGSFGLINNKGTLKIVDNTRAGGAITLKANVDRDWNAYSSVISNQPGGKLTVDGGTIEHLGGTDMAYGIDNLTNGKGTYAETEINGGTVKSPYRAIRQFLNGIEAQNILTVNGGTIEGTNKSIWMQDPSKNANTGTLIVEDDASIKGDVYLSVTEGSTEWPVDVTIVADALKDGSTVLTSNVPEGYLLVAENGLYTVETIKVKEQTINLNNGWTWISLCVDATTQEDLASFEAQLAQYNTDNQIVQIKNQTKAVTYQSYYGNYGWYGNLTSLAVNDMYMVKIEKDNVVVELEDYKVNPADYEFNLVSGWTWLGFPSTSDAPVAIEYALQNITPNKGDQIKSQEGFATYMNNKWYGNLYNMTSGKGYMYKNTSGETVELVYPAEVNYRGVAPANITAANNLMVPNMSKYANNMSIIAVVNIDGEELMSEDFEVAAFAGEELRGSARPIYLEDFNRYMLFMTVYGEANEELTFKYYDLNSGEEHNLFADSNVKFEINSTVGSIEEALVLNYGTLNIDENSLNGFNVYPNPVNRENAISFETTFDKVEVYNSLGVVVAEYANVDQIDGIDAAGIYVIKVTNDNTVKYCRVIVK